MISDWDKFVTSGQIPVEADVSCNILSSIDGVIGLALAVDSGLKWMGKKSYVLQADCFQTVNISMVLKYTDFLNFLG